MRYFINLIVVAFLVACGSVEFRGEKGSGDATPNDEGIDAINLVSWNWNCDDIEIKASDKRKAVFTGEGEHKVPDDITNGIINLQFNGKTCIPASSARDIVFVIDVSGSMVQADPVKSGSCERLASVETVISSLSSKKVDATYGLVTFNSDLKDQTTALFATKQELFDNAISSSSGAKAIKDVLCHSLGGTNYEAALMSAESLLKQNNRNNAAREVYFVSDGVPDPSYLHGKEVAARLKKDATIGTIMLGTSDDSILRNDIASRDSKGNPLHARAQYASDLVSTLNSMAQNSIKGGEISYRGIGSSGNWAVINILDYIKNDEFQTKSVKITKEEYPEGLEVIYKYWDIQGNVWENKGVFRW
jgi:hypothetical protein